MNCYNHPSEVSVATCIDCGKGLCKECASLYALPICSSCNDVRVKNDKNIIIKKYVPSIIGFIVGAIIAISALQGVDFPRFFAGSAKLLIDQPLQVV